MPDETEFATKPVLARAMVARALEAGVPARWVTTDEAYGQDSKFRTWLESRRIGYVVAVPRSQPVPAGPGTTRASALEDVMTTAFIEIRDSGMPVKRSCELTEIARATHYRRARPQDPVHWIARLTLSKPKSWPASS